MNRASLSPNNNHSGGNSVLTLQHMLDSYTVGHATVYQLIDIYHEVCLGIEAGQFTCMVFCVVSIEFDRVWNKGLLFKLKQNGVSGNVLKWAESYLTGRQQQVFIGSSLSNCHVTSAGVSSATIPTQLVYTGNGTVFTSYINTVQADTDTTSATNDGPAMTDYTMNFNGSTSSNNGWNGRYCVCRFYSKVLSQLEITQNYNVMINRFST